MRIVYIKVYQVDLPGREVRHISGGRAVASQDSTIVEIGTDSGLTGWGETCPFGPQYLPAFAEGVRAAIGVVAPSLMGADPTNINQISQLLDGGIRGQEQMKSGVEMACWDLLGKHANLPLHSLLGGMLSERPMRQGFIPAENGPQAIKQSIDAARRRGVPHFEFKATGDLVDDIELIELVTGELNEKEILKVDANGGWPVHVAERVMAVAPDMHILYEQPCATYEQCRVLRKVARRPIILDETAVTMEDVTLAIADGVLGGLNLKIARVGGLAKARALRDLCVSQNIPVMVQCVGGSEITAAAIAHLAHTVPATMLLSVWNPLTMVTVRTARGLPDEAESPFLRAGTEPGLGVTPLEDVLGAPVATFG